MVVVVQSPSLVQLFAIPWSTAPQAPLSMGFPSQEHWSGFHFLLQVIFGIQGSNSRLLHWQADYQRGTFKLSSFKIPPTKNILQSLCVLHPFFHPTPIHIQLSLLCHFIFLPILKFPSPLFPRHYSFQFEWFDYFISLG